MHCLSDIPSRHPEIYWFQMSHLQTTYICGNEKNHNNQPLHVSKPSIELSARNNSGFSLKYFLLHHHEAFHQILFYSLQPLPESDKAGHALANNISYDMKCIF